MAQSDDEEEERPSVLPTVEAAQVSPGTVECNTELESGVNYNEAGTLNPSSIVNTSGSLHEGSPLSSGSRDCGSSTVRGSASREVVNIYNVGVYELLHSSDVGEVELFPEKRGERSAEDYSKYGLLHRSAAVILVHTHCAPHLVLFSKVAINEDQQQQYGLLSVANNSDSGLSSTNEISALENELQRLIKSPFQGTPGQPPPPPIPKSAETASKLNNPAFPSGNSVVKVQQYLGTLYISEFTDSQLHPRPFVAPHVTRPKEEVSLFLVQVAPLSIFLLPPNYAMKAIPFHRLTTFHLPVAIQSIPYMLCRFRLTYLEEGGDDLEVVPPSASGATTAVRHQRVHTGRSSSAEEDLTFPEELLPSSGSPSAIVMEEEDSSVGIVEAPLKMRKLEVNSSIE